MPSLPTGSAEPSAPLLLGGLSRRHLLIGGVAAGGALALGGVPSLAQEAGFGAAPADPADRRATRASSCDETRPPEAQTRSFGTLLTESPDRGIMFPVFPNSAASWTDTYGACRVGCSACHQGQDLMAPKMTKLRGRQVRHRRRDAPRQQRQLALHPGRRRLVLLLPPHQQRHAGHRRRPRTRPSSAWGPRLQPTPSNPTAARGLRVSQGEHVAYCGDSGNAEGSGSHLHFEIRKPAEQLLQRDPAPVVVAVGQPRESLRDAEPARIGPAVPPADVHALDHLDRPRQPAVRRPPRARRPPPPSVAYWTGLLDAGTRSPAVVHQLHARARPSATTKAHAVSRLYQAFFLRPPDYGRASPTGPAGRRAAYPLSGRRRRLRPVARVPVAATAAARQPRLRRPDLPERAGPRRRRRAASPTGPPSSTRGVAAAARSWCKFSDSPENRALQATCMRRVRRLRLHAQADAQQRRPQHLDRPARQQRRHGVTDHGEHDPQPAPSTAPSSAAEARRPMRAAPRPRAKMRP